MAPRQALRETGDRAKQTGCCEGCQMTGSASARCVLAAEETSGFWLPVAQRRGDQRSGRGGDSLALEFDLAPSEVTDPSVRSYCRPPNQKSPASSTSRKYSAGGQKGPNPYVCLPSQGSLLLLVNPHLTGEDSPSASRITGALTWWVETQSG
ncbi:unnamed protein product [Lota lota]